MRSNRLFLFLFSLLISAPTFAVPRLVVFIVVDQLRSDQLFTKKISYSHGYKTLLDQGYTFLGARFNHVPTNTAPGHALLLTGEPPSKSGIVDNHWWDRSLKRVIKCTYDPIHKESPKQLEVPTIGDQLKLKNEKNKVVSLSIKSRSAILMGGQKADMVLWYQKKTGTFISSSYYIENPKWVKRFNKQLKGKVPPKKSSKAKKEAFLFTPQPDRNLMELSVKALTKMNLGKGEGTDLLCVSFSVHDYVGHKYGPFGSEMKKHLQNFDEILGEFLSQIKNHMENEEFLVVLTSDHGVLPLPEGERGQKMGAQRITSFQFRKEIRSTLGTDEGSIQHIRPPNIYFKNPTPEKLTKWAEKISMSPSIEQVFIPENWTMNDPFEKHFKNGYFPNRSGDLMVRLKPMLIVRYDNKGTTHGSPYIYDSTVPLVLWGTGLQSFLSPRPVNLSDLAPSLAKKIRVSFPKKPRYPHLCQAMNCR